MSDKRNAEVIWGLDWRKHFPVNFGDYKVELSNVTDFISLKRCPDSFLMTSDNSSDNFVKDINSKAKEAYLELNSDFFAFKINGEIVGLIIGEVRDWSSYYIRFMNIDKSHRRNNLSAQFCVFIEKILSEHNVDKILIDVSLTNNKQVLRMSQLGYISTGNILSERFGAYIHFTKFLRNEALDIFSKNFSLTFYPSTEEAMKPSSNSIREYI